MVAKTVPKAMSSRSSFIWCSFITWKTSWDELSMHGGLMLKLAVSEVHSCIDIVFLRMVDKKFLNRAQSELKVSKMCTISRLERQF